MGVASFTTSGDGQRNPDVVAPGKSIDSLRMPGSRIDAEHPEGYVSDALFRGSGSSQAAAVVSGSVALLLEARPELTPDQVKAVLRRSARSLIDNNRREGKGLIDVAAAIATPVRRAQQTWTRSTGLGSLEAARGDDHVVIDGIEIRGEVTAWGAIWDPVAWLAALDAGTSWTGNSWTGNSWTGNSWTGNSWTGNSWSGSSWSGSSWSGSSWSGSSWSGSSWSGSSWSGNSWSGSSWS